MTTTPRPHAGNYIAGEWLPGDACERLAVTDPATAEALGSVPLSGRTEVDRAVQAARAAFPAWRRTPVVERARVLFRLKALLDEHHDDLAVSLSREHGKNVPETWGEVQRGIENVEHAAGMPTLMMGDTLEDVARGVDCETVRQPIGVFAVVTPYNFPVMIPLWFWPYAVAAGNTAVLKPSEQDPLTHQRVVELAARAGLPPGVLNVVHGRHQAVVALIDHPDVAGVSFVGSSRVAKIVYARAGAAGKRVQALGGAKNHMIVLPDADPEMVADAVVGSVFGSAGQRCLAGSVVVGVGDAYGPMRDGILDGAAGLRMGRGLDEGVDMGPVISGGHRDRVNGFIDEGERDGARLVMDGRRAEVTGYPRGHWVGPTVFEDVTPEMPIGREEVFGPVAGLARAPSLEAALELLGKSPYGNAASIFTNSGRAAREFRYRAGISMIGVNIGVAAPMAFFPFGGARNSFYGDLKAQGRDAVSFYTDQRVVISRW
ncbi:MAG: CoA-acylating methylmalonate-semialdehyde dehydrogenase [Gemmatimonadota bacterium]|nr:CoA-acylating methylmalonate-semialdehyde dehydrogenase [Gemmatimonadota bacterium]MDE2986217.1 CoA-acylating methylmalonate-semialdehyde dehydrogenase [Gemmatimonadota bacterium]